MESQSIAIAAAAAGLLVGVGVAWLMLRSRLAATQQTAAEAASALQIELASAKERVRFLEDERAAAQLNLKELAAQGEQWRTNLESARAELSELRERASRVAILDSQIQSTQERAQEHEAEIRRLSESNAQKHQALASAQEQITELQGERAKLAQRIEEGAAALTAARDQCAAGEARIAELTKQVELQEKNAQAQLATLQEARESLSHQFKSLANEILEEKSKRFTEQNQANLGQLLDPLKLKITEFQAKVEDVYIQEGKDRSALAEQVRQLSELNRTISQDAKNLTRALKGSSKTQGNWGELVLERVLEASGLRKGEEYDVQESHTRADGSRVQPDVVIHLPEDRHLVVDAKVSLNAYEDYTTAEEDGERQAAAKRHLDSIRTHMKGLSEKNYQSLYGIKSLDFVLMFVPIEPAFMLAVTQDRELFMDAWQKNVLMVSPSTLLFVVRTVAHLWRQEAQTRNAQDIAKRGAELYDKLVGFVADLESVGTRLSLARDAYEAARNKLSTGRGNVIRQAEMLRELGVKPSKKLPAQMVDGAVEDGPGAPDS